ncbi:MAG: glutamine amidotransferase-related protein [Bacillota bacterium]
MSESILLLHDGHPIAWNLAGALHRLGATPSLADWTRQGAPGTDPWDIVVVAGNAWPPGAADGQDASSEGRNALAAVLQDPQQPLLAVGRAACLLAARLGGQMRPSVPLRHGHPDTVRHRGRGLLAGLSDPLQIMRYDSHLPADLPEYLSSEAWTEAGETLAWRHTQRPWWGVCFHPGSLFAGPSAGLMENLVRRGKEVLYASP